MPKRILLNLYKSFPLRKFKIQFASVVYHASMSLRPHVSSNICLLSLLMLLLCTMLVRVWSTCIQQHLPQGRDNYVLSCYSFR
jgi:hypothetical protein